MPPHLATFFYHLRLSPGEESRIDEVSVILDELLRYAEVSGASDIHLMTGSLPVVRVGGDITTVGDKPLTSEEVIAELTPVMSSLDLERFSRGADVDFAFSASLGRIRANAFHHRGGYGVSLRRLPEVIPSLEELGVPTIVKTFALESRGLVLITGATGSGKTTTAAALIKLVNEERAAHIITIEDPIEFVHCSARALVTQREVRTHTPTFADALRSALREDPDVLFIGEMRDRETIDLALKAAETGHLVISTLHTIGAARAITRIVDVFPGERQEHVRSVLAEVLVGIVSQELVGNRHGGRALVSEVLISTPAVRALIRDGKVHQIDNLMQTSRGMGMQTREMSLKSLVERGEARATRTGV